MTVSVIIPTWNRANSIARAIRSALEQTVSPEEILVCDDGSSDETERVISGLNERRVRWLPGDRGGRPAIPRNRGLRAAAGEWIAFLDSDDAWEPQKLAIQLGALHQTSWRACSSNATAVRRDSARLLLDFPDTRVGFTDLLRVNYNVCSSVLLHRSLLQSVGGFPESADLTAAEDHALWLRVATQTDFVYVSDPLVVYEDEPAVSVRAWGTQDVRLQRLRVLQDFLSWANQRGGLGRFVLRARLMRIWLIATGIGARWG